MKYIIVFILVLCLTSQIFASPKKNGNDYLTVKAMASHTELTPNSQLMLIFDFKIQKGWHIYWKNPGDTGLPTDIKIDTDDKFKTEGIIWAVPKMFPFKDMVIYGYDDSVRLIVPLNIPKDMKYGTYNVKAYVDFLVCKEECLPGKDTFNITFKVSDKSQLSSGITNINLSAYPINASNEQITTVILNDTLLTDIQINPLRDAQYYAEFYPEDQGYYIYSGIKATINENLVSLKLPLDKYREEDPKELKGILIFRNLDGHQASGSFYVKKQIMK